MATRIREKTIARNEHKDNRPKAIARHIRISPSKIRIILNEIRGKKLDDAVAILMNMKNIGCESVVKVVNSAAANAENNQGMAKADLYIAEAFVDGGPTLKRIQPVSKGRAHEIKKRTSHITIILDAAK